jgi:pyruvate,orthophosphate dikinase
LSLTAHEFEVLNYLDIRKSIAGPEPVKTATGLNSEEVRAILERFERRGYFLSDEMRITSWGEEAARSYRQNELGEAERNRLVAAYGDFDRVNSKVKQLVTDWQIRRIGGLQVVNDHTDQEYDFMILSRLFDLRGQTERIFSELLPIVGRYGSYRKRLDLAVEKIKEGNPDYLSKPSLDSYHTVWFEFHEDLLNLMGKKRVE